MAGDTTHNAAITDTVMEHVPAAEVLSSAAGELSFRLPMTSSSKFPDLFELLDTQGERFGIDSYVFTHVLG